MRPQLLVSTILSLLTLTSGALTQAPVCNTKPCLTNALHRTIHHDKHLQREIAIVAKAEVEELKLIATAVAHNASGHAVRVLKAKRAELLRKSIALKKQLSKGRKEEVTLEHKLKALQATGVSTTSKVTATSTSVTAKATSTAKTATTRASTVRPTTSRIATSVKPATTTTRAATTTTRSAKTTTRASKTTTRTAKTTTKASSATSASTVPPVLVSKPTHQSTSNKKGLGFNTASFTTAFTDKNSLSFVYNWASRAPAGLSTNVEFVPMLWGQNADGWVAAANAAIANGATHLLGFNEPDLGAQSNLSPAEAAAFWETNMAPFKGRAKLISPAITNGGAPGGVAWMKTFLSLIKTQPDAIAAHWYDSATNEAYFTNYFTDMSNEFKLPIWITEFAGSGSVAQQQQFLQDIIPWMENASFIERYAAFGDFAGTFVDANGNLTPLGATYANTI